jgi:hypothetical protein
MIYLNHIEPAITLFEPERYVICCEHEGTDLFYQLNTMSFVISHCMALSDEGLHSVCFVRACWDLQFLTDYELVFEYRRVEPGDEF